MTAYGTVKVKVTEEERAKAEALFKEKGYAWQAVGLKNIGIVEYTLFVTVKVETGVCRPA